MEYDTIWGLNLYSPSKSKSGKLVFAMSTNATIRL